jgi:hypothetical protein
VKVVFLDFDNVLNHVGWKHRRYPFDPDCIERLCRLTSTTGAEIVVSSSWRNNRRYATDAERLAWLRGLLEGAGATGEVVGLTPNVNPRSKAIKRWLKDHKNVTCYVVLDDDASACIESETFIQTSGQTGIIDADVDRAIAILSV